MERLTTKSANGRPIFKKMPPYEEYEPVRRLSAIEDILGDDYDLDRLRELVEADKYTKELYKKIKSESKGCPKCGSSDVLPTVDRKYCYCFSCETKFPYKEYIGAKMDGGPDGD